MRVVRFYTGHLSLLLLLLLFLLLLVLFASFASQWAAPDLSGKLANGVGSAGPQTGISRAEWAAPDFIRQPHEQGRQRRLESKTPKIPERSGQGWTSMARKNDRKICQFRKNFRRYVRRIFRRYVTKNARRNVKKNFRRYVRKNTVGTA